MNRYKYLDAGQSPDDCEKGIQRALDGCPPAVAADLKANFPVHLDTDLIWFMALNFHKAGRYSDALRSLGNFGSVRKSWESNEIMLMQKYVIAKLIAQSQTLKGDSNLAKLFECALPEEAIETKRFLARHPI